METLFLSQVLMEQHLHDPGCCWSSQAEMEADTEVGACLEIICRARAKDGGHMKKEDGYLPGKAGILSTAVTMMQHKI